MTPPHGPALLPQRDGLTPGQSLVLAVIARACRPLTSQHFWDQMAAVPAATLPAIEEAVVRRVVAQEGLAPDTLFYDTTNFFTFIDSTNGRPTLPRRGHNKQKRHDLRQLGLALVVSREGQLPLFHLLYEGDRPDVRTFPEVLTSVRTRLERLFGAAPPVTLVLVPSQHAALLAEALVRSPRSVLRQLEAIREVMVIEAGARGRPRVRRQLEELDPPAARLARCFALVPRPDDVVTTDRPG